MPTYALKQPTYECMRWSNDPAEISFVRAWLEANYGPETEGTIYLYDNEEFNSGPLSWEIDTNNGDLFVKQEWDKFRVPVGDWLILLEGYNVPNDLATITDGSLQYHYEAV